MDMGQNWCTEQMDDSQSSKQKKRLAALNPCLIPTFMANPFWPWEMYLVNVYIAVENHHAISV